MLWINTHINRRMWTHFIDTNSISISIDTKSWSAWCRRTFNCDDAAARTWVLSHPDAICVTSLCGRSWRFTSGTRQGLQAGEMSGCTNGQLKPRRLTHRLIGMVYNKRYTKPFCPLKWMSTLLMWMRTNKPCKYFHPYYWFTLLKRSNLKSQIICLNRNCKLKGSSFSNMWLKTFLYFWLGWGHDKRSI